MIGWGTPREIAIYVGRSAHTVRNWVATMRVTSACDLETRRIVVHAAAARRQSDATSTRQRTAA